MPRYKLRTPWYYRLPWHLLMAAATWAGFRFGHDVLPQRQAHADSETPPAPAASSVMVSRQVTQPLTEMREWLATVQGMDAGALAAEWQKAEQTASAPGAGPLERARAELLLEARAKADPAAIHQELTKAGQSSAARRVLQRWAARDGKAAFAYAVKSSDPGDRAAAWLAIADHRADEAASLLDDPANSRILTQLAGQLQPAEMSALLARLPSGNTAVQAMLKSPVLNDPSAAPVLEGESVRQRERLEEALRRTGPEAAAALATDMTPQVQAWLAAQIPAGLLPAFTKDVASRGWASLLPALVKRWAGFDPSAAEAFIAANGGTDDAREAQTAALWDGLFAGLPERLAERATRLDSVPEALRPRVIERIVRFSPGTALALFGKLPQAARTENLIQLMVEQLAQDDPRAAGQWVIDTLPEVRQGAPMRKIAAAWISQDPLRAAEWITDLPLGQARDHATAELAMRFLQMEDTTSAEAWAHLVNDSGLRDSLLQKIVPPVPAGDSSESEPGIEPPATSGGEGAPVSAEAASLHENPSR